MTKHLNFAQRLQAGQKITEREFDQLVFEANQESQRANVHTALGLSPTELALFLEHDYTKAVEILKAHRGFKQ